MASSPRDEALVRLLLERWQDTATGLDSAKTYEYSVLLSFPNEEQPNVVEVGEVLSGNAGVERAAAEPSYNRAFSHSGPGWNGLPLLPTPREKSDRGAAAQSVATICCLCTSWHPTGEPGTPPHILALLGSPSSHSEAEASEKHFKQSPNPFTDLTPAAVTPTLHPSVSHSANTS